MRLSNCQLKKLAGGLVLTGVVHKLAVISHYLKYINWLDIVALAIQRASWQVVIEEVKSPINATSVGLVLQDQDLDDRMKSNKERVAEWSTLPQTKKPRELFRNRYFSPYQKKLKVSSVNDIETKITKG